MLTFILARDTTTTMELLRVDSLQHRWGLLHRGDVVSALDQLGAHVLPEELAIAMAYKHATGDRFYFKSGRLEDPNQLGVDTASCDVEIIMWRCPINSPEGSKLLSKLLDAQPSQTVPTTPTPAVDPEWVALERTKELLASTQAQAEFFKSERERLLAQQAEIAHKLGNLTSELRNAVAGLTDGGLQSTTRIYNVADQLAALARSLEVGRG
jgi:hypothetical protein